MRVLVLSHLYPHPDEPTRGIFVHEQVAALRRRGVDARVLSGEAAWLDPTRPLATWRALRARGRERAPAAFGEHDGVPLARFRYLVPRGLWGWTGSAGYRAAALEVASSLRAAFPFDLVHAHTALLDGFAGLGAAERWRVPLVLTEHSGPFRVLTATGPSRRRTAAAVAGATRGIAVSEALARAIRAEVPVPRPERWRVIPNGVDAARFAAAAAAAPPRGEGRIAAVWIGHLLPVKRPLLLLEAFARARQEEPRLALTLVGGGPLEPAVRARVASLGLADHVQLQPFADREGVARALAESDLLVLSSESETFGVVVIEALAAGRPVLSTRCGGPEEILTDPRLGALVEADEASLARGWVALARHERDAPGSEREAAAAWRREAARRRFDHGVVAAKVAAVYDEAITSPS